MRLDRESSKCPAISRSQGTRRSLGMQLCHGGASGGQPTLLPPLLSSFPMLLTSSPDRSCMWTGGRLLALACGGIKEMWLSKLIHYEQSGLLLPASISEQAEARAPSALNAATPAMLP